MPELSVIIPMHNGAATVGRALESLRAQREQDWEAIVVDDGSTDAGLGADTVREAARSDPRVRLVCQPNGGVSRARNRGLDEARGRFVLLLDADDWMLPGGVDALLEAARASGTGAAVGKFEMVGRGSGGVEEVLSVEGPWSEELSLSHLLGGIFMTTHGHVVERRFYQHPEPLRFDPSRRLIEDTDLWIRLAERGVRWTNCQRPVGAYLMRPDSRSVKFADMFADTLEVYTAAYQRAAGLQGPGGTASGVDISEARLNTLLAHAALGYATRIAVSGADRTDAAAELVGRIPGRPSYQARQMARAARHAVMFALGARPAPDGMMTQSWGLALRRWWERCESRGWCAPGAGAEAIRQFELHEPGAAKPPAVATRAN